MLNKYIEKIRSFDLIFILLVGVFITFPLEKVNPKFIFGLIIIQFYFLLKSRTFKLKLSPFFWMLIALYTLNFLGLFYSQDLSRAFNVITRQISFVLFPIFYASYNLKKTKLLLITYCVSICSFILIFEGYTLFRFFYKSDIFPLDLQLFLSFRYTGSELTKLIEMHNAYFGMYIIMSNILIVSFLKSMKNNFYIVLLILLIIIQSLFLMQMIAKTAIIINFIIIFPSLIYYLVSTKKYKILLFSSLITIILGVFTVTKFNLPINRIIDRIEELNSPNTNVKETRGILWKNALPVIKESLVFGYGTGDANKTLIDKYEKIGLKTNTNVHNQYLDYLLRFGIVGLCLFLIVFGYGLYLSIKLKNYVYFCFLVLILGSCFTENILSRQWGITFFASFNYMLYLIALKTYKWE